MNKVILAGRLVRDPELRYTQTGKAVVSFSLAVNRRFNHNQEQTADFIPIVVWDKLAEVCNKHLFKGSQVLIKGRIQIRSYDAQDGSKRYVTEVIAQELEFMGSKPTALESKPLSPQAQNFGQEVHPDEEIPF
ncbi:single-stranded DNA-binding protein [uncultured Megamonas sp.]|uniref:single-stranded DNA-binding protein n=1 Tax=uncultured Megamonas sp. TaxID=286140 RepID=UPI00187653F9|nr:single-stranded DNA-binding protein [uncultured Megamonas sp.]MBE5061073.1 single-stranded DNA-binding protein [Megamonas funiformis]